MQQVALLGLGIMGGGMAHNLLKAGFPLIVYNRTREKAQPFADAGAQIAATPREAAQNADVVVVMVANDDASRALWLAADGGYLVALVIDGTWDMDGVPTPILLKIDVSGINDPANRIKPPG